MCGYSSPHPDKDRLKFKELIYYVNFIANDFTPNALTKKSIKKLARQNNCYKLNKPLTFRGVH